MSVMDELKNFILTEMAVDSGNESLAPDEDLIMRGIIDSMGIMKLVAFIQEKFGITVDDTDIVPENFQNLASLAEFIQKKKT